MARVLLVGQGPLPAADTPQTGFPQLRVDGIRRVLEGRGHAVDTLLVGSTPGLLDPHSDWEPLAQARTGEVSPDCVVSAGPYWPAAVATVCAGEALPLLVDVPGDPFAEAQVKDSLNPELGGRATLETQALWWPVLARGDAFLGVSKAQVAAILGQLGYMGRLPTMPAAYPWAHLAPVAHDFGMLPGAEPRGLEPGEPLRVLLAGGFNTWLDAPTLLEGLHQAMDSLPGLEVHVTGGGVVGHHEGAFADFHQGAMSGPHPHRFVFHGWVPNAALPAVVQGCHLLLSLDRPGVEPLLGSRTRLLFATHQGLAIASSVRTELAQELAAMGHLYPLEMGSPGAIAELLQRLTRQGIDPERIRRAQAFLHRRYRGEEALGAVADWVSSPTRTPAFTDPNTQLASEVNRLRSELARIHGSPTWRVSAKVKGLLKRD
ncbi:MAG: hypothetical protein VX899_00320 [Myxococcota bacterium]|nr:hypothetical protein [Myxococcota bacterium]